MEGPKCGHRAVCHVFLGLWPDPEEGHPQGDPGQIPTWLRTHWGDKGFLEHWRAHRAAPQRPGMCCSLCPAAARLTELPEIQVPPGGDVRSLGWFAGWPKGGEMGGGGDWVGGE